MLAQHECLSSRQRRAILENTIREVNKLGWFKDRQVRLEPEQLVRLRDVDTRWSSILYTVDRLIVNYPVGSHVFLCQWYTCSQMKTFLIVVNAQETGTLI